MQLHLLPHLKRFSLTKGHKYMDESMLATALRILKYNQSLKQISIRWARERCPNHLKQEGTYEVFTDFDGLPEYLMVVERGIPLLGAPFVRRYKHKLDKDSGQLWKLDAKRRVGTMVEACDSESDGRKVERVRRALMV